MISNGSILHTSPEYFNLIRSMETIGWRGTMEGMISTEFLRLPIDQVMTTECRLQLDQWMGNLTTKLLEATHGIWIYRNLVMHDRISGHAHTRDKEELLTKIERQHELGGEGLDMQDQWMIELNTTNLENTTGERV
jgi:hypothetical protein